LEQSASRNVCWILTNMCVIDSQTRTFIPCGPIVEVKQCAMCDSEWGDPCENEAVDGSEFCTEHVTAKLCKTSGLRYCSEGNKHAGRCGTDSEIPPHPVDDGCGPTRTTRAEFCRGDRCRNLWRDTNKSRERSEAITRLKDGKSDPNYTLVKVEGVDRKILLNKNTGRYHWNVLIR
jgi:hypothetical protein